MTPFLPPLSLAVSYSAQRKCVIFSLLQRDPVISSGVGENDQRPKKRTVEARFEETGQKRCRNEKKNFVSRLNLLLLLQPHSKKKKRPHPSPPPSASPPSWPCSPGSSPRPRGPPECPPPATASERQRWAPRGGSSWGATSSSRGRRSPGRCTPSSLSSRWPRSAGRAACGGSRCPRRRAGIAGSFAASSTAPTSWSLSSEERGKRARRGGRERRGGGGEKKPADPELLLPPPSPRSAPCSRATSALTTWPGPAAPGPSCCSTTAA